MIYCVKLHSDGWTFKMYLTTCPFYERMLVPMSESATLMSEFWTSMSEFRKQQSIRN